MHKERKLNLLTKECRCLYIEIQIAQPVAIAATPAAVTPRSDNQKVRGVRIVLFYCAVNVKRPHRVFGIEPSAHVENRGRNVVHEFPKRPGLPELVVVWMIDDLLPVSRFAVEIFIAGFGERTHLQKKLISVGGAEIEIKPLLWDGRLASAWSEYAIKTEVRA